MPSKKLFLRSAMTTKRKLRAWTCAEELRLRQLYPTATCEELLAAFPHRTLDALKTRACALGLKSPRKSGRPQGVRKAPLIRSLRRAITNLERQIAVRRVSLRKLRKKLRKAQHENLR